MSEMVNKEKLDLIAIKTDDGRYYLSERKALESGRYYSELTNILINGKSPKSTFEEEWVYIESEPKSITKMIGQPNINYRYELTDKTLISTKLPEFIDRDFVATKIEYDWIWKEDMKQYRSLYILISDPQEDKEEILDFSIEVILIVPEIINPIEMNYNITKVKDGVIHQLADKIIFPSIVLTQRPCKLTSYDSYQIVRKYIKDNIDPKIATITSDYDFCFTVKKRIQLAKIKKYTVDVNNGIFSSRKRKSKYVEKQQVEKLEECFEMTNDIDKYGRYSIMKEFTGNTQKELKNKIDSYCKEVTSFINTPLVECIHCDGKGVVVPKKTNNQERKHEGI